MIQKFKQSIYPFDLIVVIGDSCASLNNKFEDIETGLRINFSNNKNYDAYTLTAISYDRRRYTVIIHFEHEKSVTYGTIAHEAVHGAKMIFNRIGADIIPHEPFEYLVGYIADCCGDTYDRYIKSELKE